VNDVKNLPDIIVHNAGRRTHVAKVAGAHQGKISGLCWADDNRILSCGVDRNIKMWDARIETQLDSSGAGPSQVRVLLHPGSLLNLTLLQPKPLAVFPGKGTLQSVLDTLSVSLSLS
jgi:WD repeat and SOF domain-containing protein 1